MKHLEQHHILNAQVHFRLLMFVFLSVDVMLNILLAMFVRLLACSLPGWRWLESQTVII